MAEPASAGDDQGLVIELLTGCALVLGLGVAGYATWKSGVQHGWNKCVRATRAHYTRQQMRKPADLASERLRRGRL